MHLPNALKRWPLRRLCSSVLLPLLLLLAQQGALLHELSHYAADDAPARRNGQHPQAEHCQLCLAYAQIAPAPAPGQLAPQLLAGLRFERTATISAGLDSAAAPAPRSRGPPTAA